MKHFFFPYKSEENNEGILNDLFDKWINNENGTEDEHLKGIYDAVDTIYDKRLEEKDGELKALVKSGDQSDKVNEVKNKNEDKDRYEFLSDYKDDEGTIDSYRIKALKTLWNYLEDRYRAFRSKEKVKITLILYHLVRGNICLRISEIYNENYDLEQSDLWGHKAIEILWHGKMLAVNYRDSLQVNSKGIREADLYLRVIKLNLAKYYRDYAGKNRRSDFDAALDEFKHVRRRVEDEINKAEDEYSRQYTLIWLDAILNIARIHREKHQVEIAKDETLFLFYRLKDVLEKDQALYREFAEFIEATNKLAQKEHEDKDLLSHPRTKEDLPNLCNSCFDKYVHLNSYDKKRYFLLVLLDLSQIWRYSHSVEYYSKAIFTAIIADKWSKKMDVKVAPGHNVDALNIISSSLRKYIKFGEEESKIEELLKEIKIEIGTESQSLKLRSNDGKVGGKVASLPSFLNKLYEYAERDHLKSKIEVIKWHCLYQQKRELLSCIKTAVKDERIQSFFHNDDQSDSQDSKRSLQFRFLQGLVHFRKGEYQQAINIFEELTENKMTQYIRPGTIGLKTQYTLANCYMSLAQFGKAEVILKSLHDALEVSGKRQKNPEDDFDADKEPRVEIDLAYCYMQRGDYKSAYAIYKELYSEDDAGNFNFDPQKMKQERCIMGLNNYAACSIFSINNESNIINDESSIINDESNGTNDKQESVIDKIKKARKIFNYLDDNFVPDRDDPETNLLKGYYTLCVGIEPQEEIGCEQVENCMHITEPECIEYRNNAIIKAHKYFQKACRFETGFTERYVLQRKDMTSDKARCRNEVERVSAYIINLIKLYNLEEECFDIRKRDIQRLILSFPTNYEISLKAAIALAEWLLTYKEKNQETGKDKLIDQMFRSFSYVTIYEERGARVFNLLRENREFRFFTAVQRGEFFALLLAMYKPIKAIKEECCFNLEDKERTPHLVHYTSINNLKKIFADEDRDKSVPRFRINNCGYMNDVFEGNTLLNCIKLVAEKDKHKSKEEDKSNELKEEDKSNELKEENTSNESKEEDKSNKPKKYSEFIKEYFPQIDRSHEDMLPSGSDVYIGSLSVKEDSFPLWSIYAEKECGCNIEFGDGFFGINGIPYCPKALRDYLLSQYTDQDYPLYIVQYIGSKFKDIYYKKYIESNKLEDVDFEIEDAEGHLQDCGTRAIKYRHLYKLLQQIYTRWKELDDYLSEIKFEEAISSSKEVICAFAADRINEIRFLFKDADYEFEGEVRIVYTHYADPTNSSKVNISTIPNVPHVYVDMNREIKEVSVRLGSRIEDATVDQYVTWLKHTNLVKKVDLSKRNRYTHQTMVEDLL